MWFNNTYKNKICDQIYDVVTNIKAKYVLNSWLMNTYEGEICGHKCDVVIFIKLEFVVKSMVN